MTTINSFYRSSGAKHTFLSVEKKQCYIVNTNVVQKLLISIPVVLQIKCIPDALHHLDRYLLKKQII